MARLERARVLVVGVGGVGSWCAEALVRTGVGHLALMDDDIVAPSNVNRQCPATAQTLGRAKVEAMRARLLEIDPACDVEAWPCRYESAASLPRPLADFSLVIDAIDSVPCKASLILEATRLRVPILSSMGAARRLDPTRVAMMRFNKVAGDGLARALRQHFKRLGACPDFRCAASDECPCEQGADGVKGSLMPVTCAFGMALAAEAIKILSAP